MPLTGKYLKYSPEITLEIFTLIWDKLKLIFPNGKIYDLVEVWDFDTFKEKGYISIWGSGKYCFGINNNAGLGNYSETTVQEILGYDPFVKEDCIFPEKWYIKSTPESRELLEKWSGFNWKFTYIYFNGKSKSWSNILYDDHTEITFEQFKKYMLKKSIENPKESIPEYVECIEGYSDQFTKGKIYKISTTFISDYQYHTEIDDRGLPNGWDKNKFKPSTKEAFDAQNKPKPIEKWSVGSYGVVINSTNQRFPIGFIDKIILTTSHKKIKFENYYSYDPGNLEYSSGLEFKWFATKSEAEEFAKTLIESTEETNRPLKQAVHCKTQEEWDFVTEKLGYKWSEYSKWDFYKNNICINLNRLDFGTADVAYMGYQILSFQEWCDLNGYKMEKEVKFEVGKWYKSNCFEVEYYLKYDKTIREINYNKIFYSILIRDGKIEENDYIAYTALEKSFNLLTDLSEIQQYLPDDHPDKIKSNDFKVGDWVIESKSRFSDINRAIGYIFQIRGDGSYYEKFMDGHDQAIDGDNKYCINYNKSNIRHATPEEIQLHAWKSCGNAILSNSSYGIGKTGFIERLDKSLSIFPTFEEKPSIKITEFEEVTKDYFINFKDPYN